MYTVMWYCMRNFFFEREGEAYAFELRKEWILEAFASGTRGKFSLAKSLFVILFWETLFHIWSYDETFVKISCSFRS